MSFVSRFARIAFTAALLAPAASGASASGALVAFKGFAPGTIVVRQNERALYLALGGGAAMRYPVGVGKAGKQWRGRAVVDGKYINPAWSPPREVKRDKPWIPDVIAGGAPRRLPASAHAHRARGHELQGLQYRRS